MSETKNITQKSIGFSFHVSIEREIRDKKSETKYPDKTIVKASLGGHADTMAGATESLKTATDLVKKQVKEVKA